LQQSGLGFRRRAVDLVGEKNIGEHRPLHELKPSPARRGIFLQDIGSRDVGRHQVGRELDAVEFEVEDFRQRADEQRLGEAGDADQQTVAAREERGQHLFDDFVLADNDLADLGQHGVALGRELFDRGDFLVVDPGRLHPSLPFQSRWRDHF